MIRHAFLALAAMSTPVMAQTPAIPPAKLLTWPDLTKRPKPMPDATVDYGTDQMQKVDVWLPKGKAKAPFPVVVMVHGGCWTTSIADRSLMNWIADDLRNAGVAVWNIDYRGVDRTGGGYPGTFADAAKAADQLKISAKTFNLDTRRVLAIGHSAGGHLALWLAARPKLPASSALHTAHPLRIRHVISLGGLPDLEATATNANNGCGTEVVAKLVGAPTPQRPDVYAETSVPRLLPLGVEQDLINGREDRIIPFVMATDYVAKATAAGDTATLHTIPATGHVELIAPETPAWAKARRLILAYVGKTR
ncbi:alpha/beta hydrolase [Sphingomonas sp. PP-CC-3G-468]|uniref:alpha/beta hydrolase family protein n=1 Tax=Sphingomonas sp. PP-CC-3G-468 TaxID=2135656 RepID=UPI0010E73C9C|nr:alpha/beta hydrolase [Sphingomonas sp. PP-CC-3G-468]TCM08438.1 acetyl esterase/lipase [Sphingomonas sp. PP-CC-3G-468]